ncbi:MAG: T9SS type A sorting domain-containing protein [Janthinobacterium lividum]
MTLPLPDKKLLGLLTLMLWSVLAVQAQGWDWATSTTRLNSATVSITQVVADAQGNSYVTGSFQDIVNFGTHRLTASQPSSGFQANPDLFVAKLTASGQWDWAVQAGGANGQAKGIGLALDASGQNLYVTGTAVGTTNFGTIALPPYPGANNGFVARLGSGGQWQWVVRTGNCGRPVLDGAGSIYVAGAFAGSTLTFGATTLTAPVNNSNIFVAWLSPAGQWLGAVSGGGTGFEEATSLAVDSNGNAYASGRFSNSGGTTTQFGAFTLTPFSSGNSDGFVAKLDSTRQWQWAVRGGPFYLGGESPKVSVTPNGRLLAWAGTVTEGSFGPYTLSHTLTMHSGAAIACLNRRGTWQWVAASTSTTNGTARTVDVGADSQGNWYATGTASNGNKFGQYPLTGTISDQAWVARLNGSTGAWQWVLGAGGLGSSLVTGVSVAGTYLYVGGSFNQSPTFGAFSLSTNNYFGSEGFVARIGSPLLATRPLTETAALALYPIPCPAGHFTLEVPAHFTTSPTLDVTISNTLGQPVDKAPRLALATDGSLRVAVTASALPAGVYVLRVQAADGSAATHRLVVE